MEIAGVCDMIVLDTDRTTELTSINFGTLPEPKQQIATQQYQTHT